MELSKWVFLFTFTVAFCCSALSSTPAEEQPSAGHIHKPKARSLAGLVRGGAFRSWGSPDHVAASRVTSAGLGSSTGSAGTRGGPKGGRNTAAVPPSHGGHAGPTPKNAGTSAGTSGGPPQGGGNTEGVPPSHSGHAGPTPKEAGDHDAGESGGPKGIPPMHGSHGGPISTGIKTPRSPKEAGGGAGTRAGWAPKGAGFR